MPLLKIKTTPEAVHIEYTGPNATGKKKARDTFWKIQLAEKE